MNLSNIRCLTTYTIILTLVAMPYLTCSAPTNQTSPATKIILDVSPIDLAADQCPTPPTQFLPYNPPSGYTPGPGCAPANQGTQPTEGDAPAGYYGGSGSGSGSGTTYQTTSAASSLKKMNPIANIWSCLLSRRRKRTSVPLNVEGGRASMEDVGEMDWSFEGMSMFGGAAGGRIIRK